MHCTLRHIIRILSTALLLVSGLRSAAQQDPQYTMYMWNMLAVNPAYAGSKDALEVTAVGRRQWVGLPGAPATDAILFHTPLRGTGLGIGGSVAGDRTGPMRSTRSSIDLAYRIRTGKHTRLSFGIKSGINSTSIKLSEIPGVDPEDPVFMSDLPARISPNVGFGIHYWGRVGYVGLTMPRILTTTHSMDTRWSETVLYREARHVHLLAGMIAKLSSDLVFKPSFMVKATPGAPLAADLSAHLIHRDRIWMGLSYRSAKELSATLAMRFAERFKLGYAYDLSFSQLTSYHGGSHELMLGYELRSVQNRVRSPRYF